MVRAQVVEVMAGVHDAEGIVGVEEEEEEEEEEMAKEEDVTTQDLECEHYVGPWNVSTLTVSSISVISDSHL
jgi:hypothetical protein